MREHSGPVLRILCLGLAALLVWQLVRLIVRPDSLAHLSIPALPALAQDTRETNAVARPQTAGSGGTNATQSRPPEKAATNALLAAAKSGTNSVPEQEPGKGGSNTVARAEAARGQTNSASRATSATTNGAGAFSGPAVVARLSSFPVSALGNRPPELPPAIRARVDRVTESEILGPVMRPLPMALLGIAGPVAFLRAPSGQTGLVKEGDELGGLKLLRIGTNRVLIEQDGKKQELMIFSGFGGDSLLPK